MRQRTKRRLVIAVVVVLAWAFAVFAAITLSGQRWSGSGGPMRSSR